jgi:ribosomal protein S17E
MGRIKSLMVKRAAKQLIDKDDNFNSSFENNKKILGSTMPSKPIRNKIAGYLARLKKTKKVKAPKIVEVPIEESPEY